MRGSAPARVGFAQKAISWLRLNCSSLTPLNTFAVLFLVASVVLTASLPTGGGLDEMQHVARVDQISAGELVPVVIGQSQYYEGTELEGSQASLLYGGHVDNNLFQLMLQTQGKLHGTDDSFSFPANQDVSLATSSYGSRGRSLEVFSNTVINSPIVYLPHLIGEAIAKLFVGTTGSVVTGMRVGGLVAFYGMVLLALAIAPRSIGWIVATVALLPNAVATIVFVSADTMTIANTLLFFSSWAALMSGENGGKQKDALTLGTAAVSGVLLGLMKFVYLPIVFLLVAVPIVFESRRDKRWLAFTIGVPAAATLVAGLHSIGVSEINTGAMFKGGVDPGLQMQWVAGHLGDFITRYAACMSSTGVLQEGRLDLFAVMGERGAQGFLSWMVVPVYCVLFLVVVCAIPRDWALCLRTERRRWSVIVALVIELLGISVLICLGLFATFSEVGGAAIEGVQARYFIPLVPLFMLCVASACVPLRYVRAKRGLGDPEVEAAKSSLETRSTVVLGILLCAQEVVLVAQVLSCLYGGV